MTVPTQDVVNTTIQSWVDTNFTAGSAIANNSLAHNQLVDSIDGTSVIVGLKNSVFALIDDVTITAATGTLTFTPGTIADDIIVIDGVYYQYVTTPSSGDGSLSTPWQVAKGGSATAGLLNLKNAINGSGGTAGTDYTTGITAHPTVLATASDATTLSAKAREAGTAGNSIATTVTAVSPADGFAWGGATLTGGAGDDVDDVVDQIYTWRDTLRGGPVSFDSAVEAQLDAALPSLVTSVEAMFY